MDDFYVYPAILLSGAPASGKDTITGILHSMDDRVTHFRKHRTGAEGIGSDTYTDITQPQFETMQLAGAFLQSHSRYNRSYGTSFAELDRMVSEKLVPVVHVGQYENLSSLRSHPSLAGALSILLLCSRDETLSRLEKRHTGYPAIVEQRIEAYDEEQKSLRETLQAEGKLDFDIIVDTTNSTPEEAARSVLFALSGINRNASLNIQKTLDLAHN